MNADPPERSRHFRGTERVNEFHCRYPFRLANLSVPVGRLTIN